MTGKALKPYPVHLPTKGVVPLPRPPLCITPAARNETAAWDKSDTDNGLLRGSPHGEFAPTEFAPMNSS